MTATGKNIKVSESDLDNLTTECMRVNEMPLRSNARKLEQLLPLLDRLTKIGYTQDALLDALNKGGIEMTMGSLRNTLYRLRNANK